jgi:hypothetical protein
MAGTAKHAKVIVGWVCAMKSEERSEVVQRLSGMMIKEIHGCV